MKPTIYNFTNIAPLYRRKLYETVLLSHFFECHFFFGTNTKSGIKCIDFKLPPFSEHQDRLHSLTNYWIRGKYLIWQGGVLGPCLFKKPDLAIFLGNFMVLSTWLAAFICRIRGIKVVFRGHGMYGNERGLKLFLRTRFYRLAHCNLVYERRAKRIMASHGMDPNTIHVFFNSLDYDVQKQLRSKLRHETKTTVFPFFADPELPTLIFVGRLTPEKKLDMLVRTTSLLHQQNKRVNLLLIGEGSQERYLKALAKKLLPQQHYYFYGACYDETQLARLISAADLCVSPGNIGLTAIHCLSFGTPVCTHSCFEHQMPEVEALEDGTTGLFFEESNLEDLTATLAHWLTHFTRNQSQMETACFKVIDTYYNPYYQEKVLLNLVEGKPPLL